MNRNEDILSTVRMFQEENLDVRTVTLGINITDCVSADVSRFSQNLIHKIKRVAGSLVSLSAIADLGALRHPGGQQAPGHLPLGRHRWTDG